MKKPRANGRAFPRKIYRFLDQEIHARRFLEGYVWISTLKWLRETDRARGDCNEARLHYFPGTIDTEVPDEHTAQKLQNLSKIGFNCMPGGIVQLYFADDAAFEVKHEPTNGYLFCSTTSPPTSKLRTAFGEFCVKITNPEAFIKAISEEMAGISGRWSAGPLDYSGRTYRGGEPIPESGTVFIGPPGNATEAEYRMFWIPRSGLIVEPFELYVPRIASLCSFA